MDVTDGSVVKLVLLCYT